MLREVIGAHVLARATLALAVTAPAGLAPLPVAAGDARSLDAIPRCPLPASRPQPDPTALVDGTRLEARLDARGALVGHTLWLGDARYRTGPRTSLEGPFPDGVVLVVTRSDAGTRMVLLDSPRGCVGRRLDLPTLVYGALPDIDRRALFLSLVEPGTRRELGVWRHDLGSGRTTRVIAPPAAAVATAVPREVALLPDGLGQVVARWCAGDDCLEVPSAVRATAGPVTSSDPGSLPPDSEPEGGSAFDPPQPVPSVAGWAPGTVLGFRWHGSETPPSWMRPALRAAAEDANTPRAHVPVFLYDADASDTFRYTSDFPSESCSQAIACASRTVPDSWTVRMRVQGYDFRWGSLRWCQLTPADGCFDVERTAIHELGHAGGGLRHTQDGGFRLAPSQSVMDAYIPAVPRSGSDLHAFGPCDIASLQLRFDRPSLDTRVSKCLDVETRLTVAASTSTTSAGESVVFTAILSMASRSAYQELSGDRLNLRSVQLRRRPAGSNGAWSTYWMAQAASPGTYTVLLRPTATFEYQAVFKAPDDEGLKGSTSNTITVRVTKACGACPDDGDA